MILSQWLKEAKERLNVAAVGTSELDALVLLEDVLNKDRAHLLAHPETKLTSAQKTKLDAFIARRVKHEPLAYIRGKTEFYGRVFNVDERVLVPRPESETMIDLLKNLHPEIVVDVGTGSGALAVIAKHLFPSKQVIALDNDPKCLEVADQNAKKHSTPLTLIKNDLLENLAIIQGMVILANLPYVPNDFAINTAANHEPRAAIFGGKDGLDLYRKLFAQLKDKKVDVLTESLPFQHEELAKIARENGFKLHETDDFIQHFHKPLPQ